MCDFHIFIFAGFCIHFQYRYVINRLSINDRIILLGVPSWANRLPIFSFLIKDASSLFLHHNYVSALLNDLFGIQSRSGCVCAGPYAQFLLGINESVNFIIVSLIFGSKIVLIRIYYFFFYNLAGAFISPVLNGRCSS